jgi:hypothetical protein
VRKGRSGHPRCRAGVLCRSAPSALIGRRRAGPSAQVDTDRGSNCHEAVLFGVVIVTGIILLLIGLVTGVGILWTIGVILVIVGVVLWILGAVGRPVRGRRHYF